MLLKRKNKKIIYNLKKFYGITQKSAKNICKNIGINPTVNINRLNRTKINNFKFYAQKHYDINEKLSNKLKLYQQKLVDIKNYRGLRNLAGLPVRGQRTHTNNKTKKKFKKRF